MRSLLLVLAVLAAGAHADEGPTPCDKVETTEQSTACAAFNRTTSERQLDESYKDLVSRLSTQYAAHPPQLADYLAKIKSAQDIWKKLRDADCAVQTVVNEPGTPAFQTAQNDCFSQMSDERSEYLQSIGTE